MVYTIQRRKYKFRKTIKIQKDKMKRKYQNKGNKKRKVWKRRKYQRKYQRRKAGSVIYLQDLHEYDSFTWFSGSTINLLQKKHCTTIKIFSITERQSV